MELSAGRAIGFDRWEVPADNLGDAWIAPPVGFAGSVNLVAELRSPNGEVADRQTITPEWASPIAPVPVLRQLTESTTLASISPKPFPLRDSQNYWTDAPLLESHITTPQSAGGGEEAQVLPVTPAPIQLQSDREEATPPEARVPIPLEASWKEIGAASAPPHPAPLHRRVVASPGSSKRDWRVGALGCHPTYSTTFPIAKPIHARIRAPAVSLGILSAVVHRLCDECWPQGMAAV
jgi:hypothetical protein